VEFLNLVRGILKISGWILLRIFIKSLLFNAVAELAIVQAACKDSVKFPFQFTVDLNRGRGLDSLIRQGIVRGLPKLIKRELRINLHRDREAELIRITNLLNNIEWASILFS
jgi:hypothetical protein